MKAKIRKTGEIVEIISYTGGTTRCNVLDRVSYIDSKGEEHPNEKLNIYWDFETVQEQKPNEQIGQLIQMLETDRNKGIDWEERRFTAAVRFMYIAMEKYKDSLEEKAKYAIEAADELIKQLQK